MGRQQYRFAFGGLKTFAFERTAQLVMALQSEPDDFLAWLWQQCADPKDESVPALGLTARLFERDGLRAALITLPEPQEIPDPYFVLLIFAGELPDFYSLEKASLDFGGSGTVLGRWLPDRRENWGQGSTPEAEAFVDLVFSRRTPEQV